MKTPLNINKVVGHQIKVCRHKLGMTQVDLAERCGIYQTYLSRIENGAANPSVFLLNAIATALGVETYTLLHE